MHVALASLDATSLDVAPPVSFVPVATTFHMILSSVGMLTAICGLVAWQVLKQRSSLKARRGLFVGLCGVALYTASVILSAMGIPGGYRPHVRQPWPELPDGAPLPPSDVPSAASSASSAPPQ